MHQEIAQAIYNKLEPKLQEILELNVADFSTAIRVSKGKPLYYIICCDDTEIWACLGGKYTIKYNDPECFDKAAVCVKQLCIEYVSYKN